LEIHHRPARHLKTSKRQKGNKKGKGGREPTIFTVVFQIMTIVGESSQKLNEKGKTLSSRCGFYLTISKNDKTILKKTKVGESHAKDKILSLCNSFFVVDQNG
jgi:hypothetical protein